MSIKKITFKGFTIRVGDRCVVTGLGSAKFELGKPGSVFEVVYIKDDSGEDSTIGIKSDLPDPRFHSLDGMVPNRHGYWVRGYMIKSGTQPFKTKMFIHSDFNFRKRNLKGMRCLVLAHVSSDHLLVEVEEDVGAGSGDGLGKKGRCLFVPKSKLKELNKE